MASDYGDEAGGKLLDWMLRIGQEAGAEAMERSARKLSDVSVNLFFTSFAKQAHRSRKGGFTGCANVFSPIPVTA